MIGIFAFGSTFKSEEYGGYRVHVADPEDRGGLCAQLNAGIDDLMNAGCDGIVFIGAGCEVQADTVGSHAEQLSNHLYPLITCGRILHAANNWKDFREFGEARRLALFNRSGTIIQNSSVLTSGYGISIANFGMNRAAIDRIARFSRIYFDCEGPLPVIQDSHPYGYGKVLSLCAWCARVTMFMLPTGKSNAVVYRAEGCNPYSSRSCDGDNSDNAIAAMNKGLATRPLGLDFFDSPNDL